MTTGTNVEWGGSDKSMALLLQILPSFYLLRTLKADFGRFVQICPTEGSQGSEGHFPLWIKKLLCCSEELVKQRCRQKKSKVDFSVFLQSSQSELREIL